MFITISGELGSGKTTVGKLLASKLNYNFFSVGDLMGELASERGLSLLEFSKKAEESDEIDRLLDERQVKIGSEKDDVVFDSRLGWYFIPKSIKLYLKVDLDEAARRIYNDYRPDEKENKSLELTKNNIIRRRDSERKRYGEYYGIDHTDEDNFDIVIDTTNIKPSEIVDMIIKKINELKSAKV